MRLFQDDPEVDHGEDSDPGPFDDLNVLDMDMEVPLPLPGEEPVTLGTSHDCEERTTNVYRQLDIGNARTMASMALYGQSSALSNIQRKNAKLNELILWHGRFIQQARCDIQREQKSIAESRLELTVARAELEARKLELNRGAVALERDHKQLSKERDEINTAQEWIGTEKGRLALLRTSLENERVDLDHLGRKHDRVDSQLRLVLNLVSGIKKKS